MEDYPYPAENQKAIEDVKESQAEMRKAFANYQKYPSTIHWLKMNQCMAIYQTAVFQLGDIDLSLMFHTLIGINPVDTDYS